MLPNYNLIEENLNFSIENDTLFKHTLTCLENIFSEIYSLPSNELHICALRELITLLGNNELDF